MVRSLNPGVQRKSRQIGAKNPWCLEFFKLKTSPTHSMVSDMNDTERVTALVEKFPRLFHGEPPLVTSHLPLGWGVLVTRLLVDLDAMLDDSQARRFQFRQIKEKIAGLRVYWQLDSDEAEVPDLTGGQFAQQVDAEPVEPITAFDRIAARVSQAEEEAARTCQDCGQPGDCAKQTSGGAATLCDACSQQRTETR